MWLAGTPPRHPVWAFSSTTQTIPGDLLHQYHQQALHGTTFALDWIKVLPIRHTKASSTHLPQPQTASLCFSTHKTPSTALSGGR
ncbi:hypothetical protein EV2_023890 [Malus domestica]